MKHNLRGSFVKALLLCMCIGSFSFLISQAKANYISPVHRGYISSNDFSPIVAFPEWLTITGNYMYFGSNIANTLVIVDISDPDHPTQIGKLRDGISGAKINGPKGISVLGDYVYVAANTTVAGDSITVANISDPTHPTYSTSITDGTSGASIKGIYSCYAYSGYLYVPSYGTNALEIMSLADPANPVHVSKILNGSGSTNLNGPYQVIVSGNYAYVTSRGGDALEIINISNPLIPFHVGKLIHNTGGSKLDGAAGLAIAGNYAYVASFNSQAMEIINISNPAAPTHVASVTTNVGSSYEITVANNYVYLSNYVNNTVQIIDVSTPASPTIVATVKNGDGGAILAHARGIAIAGSNLYVASSVGSAIEVIDVSTPASPLHRTALEPSIYLGNPRAVKIINDRYAYVLGANTNSLQVIDVVDPAHPIPLGNLPFRSGAAQMNGPIEMDFHGNYGYIAGLNTTYGTGSIGVIDISNPANPTHITTITNSPYSFGVKGIATSGDYLFASTDNKTFEVLHIGIDPSNPTQVASLANGSGGAKLDGAGDILLSGNYAFVSSRTSKALEVIDISNPAIPTHAGSLSDGTSGAKLSDMRDMFMAGKYVYATSYAGNSLEIIDVSTPTNPTHVAAISNGDGGAYLYKPYDVFVSGNYAYVSVGGMSGYNGTGALEVIDISTPTVPVHLTTIYDGNSGAKLNDARGLDILGDYAYVTSYNNNNSALEIIRIKDSIAPVIALNGPSTVTLPFGQDYTDPGATASDDLDGDATSKINTSNPVDNRSPGTYTVSYSVVDNAGNTGNTTRTVIVLNPTGGSSSLSKDICPDGDSSPSFYDGLCTASTHSSPNEIDPGSTTTGGSDELLQAYTWAFGVSITTQTSFEAADMEGGLLRSHMAKMIVNYAVSVLKKTINTGAICNFNDIQNEDITIQGYIKQACELGLMGVESDGVTPKTSFDPNSIVSRAEFGTVLSRLLRGGEYAGGYPYYQKHLEALKTEGIMKNILDPETTKELRGYVMLMLMRASK